jgi:uncharacterized protein (DUF433 family)
MSVDYADGSYFGGNVATEIGENVADLSGGTTSNVGGDGAFVGEGVRSGIDSWDKAYTNAGGTLPARFGLSDLKQFATDNKAWLAGAGALASAYGGGTNADKKTGYQGVIPQLSASRSMIAAPPTRAQGYRPGAGGIDYGGDVSYALAPGQDPWANLSGTSGTATDANLTKTDTAATGITGGIKGLPGSAGYERFIAGGGTPQGYLKVINDYLKANPNITDAQLQAKMRELGVSQTDLQTALGASNFSAAEKYALTHGMGSAGVNDSINNWLAKFPNATAQQITDAMKSVGMNMADITDAFASNPALSSKADQWNIMNNKGTSAVNSSINNYLALNAVSKTPKTEAEKQADMAQYGITAKDVQEAEALPLQNKAAAIAAGQTPASTKDIMTAYTAAEKNDTDPGAIARMVASSGLSTAQLAKDFGLKEADLNYLRGQGYLPAGYAEGGMAKGRYLQGETDGMADKLPARIGRDQPAALSHGEFVIPADVVSHMGNGNSDAGAKKLYQMMDKIRMARTGNKKQGKKINPDKFMPGGLAQAYASGGSVKHFQEGGATAAKNYSAGLTGVESNLSNWAGPYVTNMLGQGQALANMPYQAYMGQLSAGESPLQTSAFNNAANLQTPSSIGTAATEAGKIGTAAQGLNYSPTSFTNQYASPVGSSFDASQATAYMNPYLQTSLQPQLDEARRQSQITQTQNAGKMTQAGAFGGGRQAILDAETQRNLGTNLANITGQGYNTAYSNAMNQFNADQARKIQEAQFGAQYGSEAQRAGEQSKQFGAGFGLQGLQTGLQAAQAQGALGTQESQAGLNTLNTQLAAGAQQRGIESEGIAADKAQFEEARANPYKMVQYQQSLLQGLPLAAQSYQGIEPSALLKASQGASTVNALLKNLGLI